ncbi:hypothetical protein NE237_019875 [Protea cynaroides]|uniref:Uncharacterized protein n=1 Tax=Protea cynaroides TaxID=273540 RepID=A0A9Q0H8D1_9MAGN|nr:hypothetical protein NE237_019875 [Protea cynaroides]
MYLINTNDVQKEASSSRPVPSAPPQAPQFEYPPAATGIPVSSIEQFDRPVPQLTSYIPFQVPVPWSTGLCDCFDDISTSCGVSGALYMMILCMTGCSCLYSCFYRSKLRGQYFLEETPCTDFCIHCCCEECALCQEYRELNNRGFDLSIGWHGNVERQNRGIATPPTVQTSMRQ